MTLSVAHPPRMQARMRGLLPLWVGVFVYALFLLAGNRLLIDPDTLWQVVTVGQWILDHRAVPETDVYSFTMRGQPWISTQWLAQVLYAKAYGLFGWSGPVVLAAAASAATFALLAKFLSRHLSESAALVFVAAALALTVPHLLARPHVLALPVMVAWVGGTDRGRGSARRAVVLAAAADGAVGQSAWRLRLRPGADRADRARCGRERGCDVAQVAGAAMGGVRGRGADRRLLHALWLELAAGVAEHPRARQRAAADHGMAAGGFRQHRSVRDLPAAGIGLALLRGIKLPPLRILLLLGLLHMALAQGRAAEILALLAPLVLAAPLRRQIGGADVAASQARRRRRAACCSPASRSRW